MVPVLDQNNIALMPCNEKRARLMMNKGIAKPYYQKGIFCIKLLRDPKSRNYQPIALGVDPGSKREGYTVLTEKKVVLNITSDTPDRVKNNMETRRILRRNRRRRKTPYRKCKWNRSVRKGYIAPSTKSRWDVKLRIINVIRRILPITIINVEEIKAVSKVGNKKWNKSFSPLETGKKYFDLEMNKLGIKYIKTRGYDTFKHRNDRGFNKLSQGQKLVWDWEAHNVDSHCLAEISLNKEILPYKKILKLEFLQWYRRILHEQLPKKNGFRRKYGSTVSLGFARGSVVRYNHPKGKIKNQLVYVGGSSKGKISIHDLKNKERISQDVSIKDIKFLYCGKWLIQIC